MTSALVTGLEDDVVLAFREACPEKFRFLEEEYACARSYAEAQGHGTRAAFRYQNETTGVEISVASRDVAVVLERRRTLWQVLLRRHFYVTERYWPLEELLARRAPERTKKPRRPRQLLDPADVEPELDWYGEALKAYGDDVLRGNFGVFNVGPEVAGVA